MHQHRPAALFAVLACAAATSAVAQSSSAAYATGWQPQVSVFEPTSGIGGTSVDPTGTTNAYVDASVRGTLKGSVNSSGTHTSGFFAGFQNDSFLINNVGLQGQNGWAQVTLDYLWNIAVSGEGSNAQSAVSLVFGTGGVHAQEVKAIGESLYHLENPATVTYGDVQVLSATMGSEIIALMPFVFGADMPLSMELSGNSSVFAVHSAFASVDAANSVYWGGISGVFDENMNAVDYDFSSSSGLDYRQSFAPVVSAVPEPQTWALLLLAFPLLHLAHRKK